MQRVAVWREATPEDRFSTEVRNWHVHAVTCPIPWIGASSACVQGRSGDDGETRVLEAEDAVHVLEQLHHAVAEIDCVPGGTRWKDYIFRVAGGVTLFAPCTGDLYDQKKGIDERWLIAG